MSNYLLEIGVEEMPSDYVKSTKDQLKEKFNKLLDDNSFEHDDVIVESTPRRFAVFINNINSKQKEKEIKIKGPSAKISYDENNNPSKALLGFLKGRGLEVDNVIIEDFKGEDYVFVKKISKSKDISEVLKENVYELVKSLTFPRSMRWGGKSIRFARPIRWFVSLLDNEILKFDAEGIKVSNETKGHRVLGKDNIVIENQDDYEQLLKENYVILSYKERKNIILRGLNRLANENGGNFLKDEDLLYEVINIVEYPTVILGNLDNKYLKLPKEVIITPMKDHQRYFPVVDDKGNLLPYFLTVRNGDETALENVVSGNERVLTARLEDARFFYEKDMEKNLDEYVNELSRLKFYEGLGNMEKKTQRLELLSKQYLKKFGMGEDIEQKVTRAAHLSKADLVTQMVIEFTELQGVIGRIYANKNGEDEMVAKAIEEQYLPLSTNGDLPESSVGLVLSVSDKFDTICGLYAIENYVTGTKDPYGLRRQALGIINIFIENKIDVDLKELIKDSLFIYTDKDELALDYDNTSNKVLEFIIDRLKNKLLDEGYKYDYLNAIINTGASNIYDIYIRLNELNEFSKVENFDEVLNYFIRVDNLTKDFDGIEVDESLIEDGIEREVYEFVKTFENFDKLFNLRQYNEILLKLSSGMDVVNKYLDNTMINVEDEKIRNNRLSLLNLIAVNIKKIFIPEEIVK